MKYSLLVRPEAEADLRQAFDWHEEQNVGLGDDFIYQVEATLLTIEQNPFMFPKVIKDVRRSLTRRFPYAIFFVESNNVIPCSFNLSATPENIVSALRSFIA